MPVFLLLFFFFYSLLSIGFVLLYSVCFSFCGHKQKAHGRVEVTAGAGKAAFTPALLFGFFPPLLWLNCLGTLLTYLTSPRSAGPSLR